MMKPGEMFQFICNSENNYKENGDDLDWLIHEDDDTLYLVFQPSRSASDWVNNFDIGIRMYDHNGVKLYIHRGFARCYRSGNDMVMKEFLPRVEKAKGKKIVITGWSFGGAMSVLAAEDLFFRTGIKADVITFGAPNVAAFWSKATKKALFDSINSLTQYARVGDIVPICPPFFSKLKSPIKIGKFSFKMFPIIMQKALHKDYSNPELYK